MARGSINVGGSKLVEYIYTESTTADFATGTLSGVTASGNALTGVGYRLSLPIKFQFVDIVSSTVIWDGDGTVFLHPDNIQITKGSPLPQSTTNPFTIKQVLDTGQTISNFTIMIYGVQVDFLEHPSNVLKITATQGQDVTLTKNATLGWAKQINYEYDIRSDYAVDYNLCKVDDNVNYTATNAYDAYLSTGNYYTVDSFFDECTNTSTRNPFFTFGSGTFNSNGFGVTGGSGGTKNLFRGYSTSLSFTVPTGCKAILSYDYYIYHDNLGWAGSHVFPPGARTNDNLLVYNAGTDRSLNGTGYKHPYLVGEGLQSISMNVSYYGYGAVGYTTQIKNLTVTIPSPNAPPTTKYVTNTAINDAWRKVSGYFYSREKNKYNALSMSGVLSTKSYTDENANVSQCAYTVTIPADRHYYLFFKSTSWGTSSYSVQATIEGKGVPIHDENYGANGIETSIWPLGFRTAGSSIATSGSIGTYDQYVGHTYYAYEFPVITPVTNRDFFLDTNTNTSYIPIASSTGAVTLTITLPSTGKIYYIQNLKVYYTNTLGSTVYLDNSVFNSVGDLTWTPSANAIVQISTDLIMK